MKMVSGEYKNIFYTGETRYLIEISALKQFFSFFALQSLKYH
ncbi:hypothetical protein amad1_11015 [Alteromonas mediterranea DE1]|uniref:Uncharacterized protein n=2 Tax=Alteromonas mediterranea TaxID=314275 RepID=S5AEC4_9ALTE|nr:hypothetical protein MADE_1010655 [Alteromonas mediterranea DE]AFV85710.1 hypothetical protein amad1_11015 [Alteromonas mediterranea DE1]AGP78200.1 hypothetical protein I633_11320 [Alteromonas mediterranea 615]AGP82033.1 hypothetical protein I533_10315 [Alteromonas mediterranea MED64]AGP85861.1 hypothetical protein I607_10350 [Alteromonas mediterranea U4]AGP89993.1 hypothetical protein I876_10680 [Alteromonas mediterranea U7]AGP93819.1 hypothetical protein I634_10550 [Alteromonas mediterra